MSKKNITPEITFGKAIIVVIALIVVIFLGYQVFNLDTKIIFT